MLERVKEDKTTDMKNSILPPIQNIYTRVLSSRSRLRGPWLFCVPPTSDILFIAATRTPVYVHTDDTGSGHLRHNIQS